MPVWVSLVVNVIIILMLISVILNTKKYSPSCSPLSLGYSDIFHVPREGRRTHNERSILPVHWTSDLELSSSFCQAFIFTLFFY